MFASNTYTSYVTVTILKTPSSVVLSLFSTTMESDTEGGGALGQASSVLAPPNGNSIETRSMRSSNYSYANEEVIGDEASRFEVWGWYLYEFCSYFVQTVLIPVVFPLIISQLQHLPMDPVQEWFKNHQGVVCAEKEINL